MTISVENLAPLGRDIMIAINLWPGDQGAANWTTVHHGKTETWERKNEVFRYIMAYANAGVQKFYAVNHNSMVQIKEENKQEKVIIDGKEPQPV